MKDENKRQKAKGKNDGLGYWLSEHYSWLKKDIKIEHIPDTQG